MSSIAYQSVVTNGSVIVVALADIGIFTSVDSGITWVQGTYENNNKISPRLSQLAMSGDGSILFMVDANQLYYSNNKGKTWKLNTIFSDVKSVSIDASANSIFVIVDNNTADTGVWASMDRGVSFRKIATGTATNMKCNSNGSYVYWINSSNDSSNSLALLFKDTISNAFVGVSGESLPSDLSGPVVSIACDSSGQTVVLGDTSGTIWIHTNYGNRFTNWSGNTGGQGNMHVSMSSDGRTIIAYSVLAGPIESVKIGTRQDDGRWEWVDQNRNIKAQTWGSVAISADGQHVTALTSSGTFFQGIREETQFVSPIWAWTENQYFILHFGQWSDICISGELITACQSDGNIYTSQNYGDTWTINQTGQQRWQSIASSASSADGSSLIACVNGGNLWHCTNGEWVEIVDYPLQDGQAILEWTSVASDASGTHLVATASDGSGSVWQSLDAGVTWTEMSDIRGDHRKWLNLSMSHSERVFCATAGNVVLVCMFQDSESRWQSRTVSFSDAADFTSIAVSRGRVVACSSPGYIWLSLNNGELWENKTAALGERQWVSIDMDDSGKYIVACENSGGNIYTSDTYGESWRTRDVVGDWKTVVSSADGSTLAALVTNGPIYISRDFGNTWRPSSATASSLSRSQIIANIRGKHGTSSGLTEFLVGTALVNVNRPRRFTGFDDFGLFMKSMALANTSNKF